MVVNYHPLIPAEEGHKEVKGILSFESLRLAGATGDLA